MEGGGLSQTLRGALAHGLKGRRPVRRSARLHFRASDGEICQVWWQAKSPARFPHEDRRLIVFLPGGMALGDGFYIEQFLNSGALDGLDWCAFHNPGIANRLKNHKLAGFADPRYLLEFLRWLDKQGRRVILIGFSAGSVLTLKTVARLEAQGDWPVAAAVAVHGPDEISHVFEKLYSEKGSRLDIPFALWLWHVYRKSGSARFLSASAGSMKFPWLRGWPWMKELTEASLNMSFARAEEKYLSCSREIAQPLKTPVLRILARNDPIVPFESVDQEKFKNLRDVWVMPGGGHCALFNVYPDMGRRIRAWLDEHASVPL